MFANYADRIFVTFRSLKSNLTNNKMVNGRKQADKTSAGVCVCVAWKHHKPEVRKMFPILHIKNCPTDTKLFGVFVCTHNSIDLKWKFSPNRCLFGVLSFSAGDLVLCHRFTVFANTPKKTRRSDQWKPTQQQQVECHRTAQHQNEWKCNKVHIKMTPNGQHI
jgi:hypothetical protein